MMQMWYQINLPLASRPEGRHALPWLVLFLGEEETHLIRVLAAVALRVQISAGWRVELEWTAVLAMASEPSSCCF